MAAQLLQFIMAWNIGNWNCSRLNVQNQELNPKACLAALPFDIL
jgi:hypothetical protein